MKSFKQALDNLAEMPEKVVRGTLLALAGRIIDDTPADTGRLRGNWQASFDAAKTTQLQRTQKNPGGGAATDEANQTVGRYQPGQTFYLTNNLPYAAVIEFGGSKVKAPQGMLRKNVAAYQARINEAVAKAKK
jgi:hypothetical protein